jgi:hypothetical protein
LQSRCGTNFAPDLSGCETERSAGEQDYARLPPPPDKMVRFGDGSASKFPGMRWSFNHLRELMPNADVLRGEGPVAMLPREERDLGTVKFTTMDGAPMNFDEALQKTYAERHRRPSQGQDRLRALFRRRRAASPTCGVFAD